MRDWRFDERSACQRTEEWIVEDRLGMHFSFTVSYYDQGQRCLLLNCDLAAVQLPTQPNGIVRNSTEMRWFLREHNPALGDYFENLDTRILAFCWLLSFGREQIGECEPHPERPQCFGVNVQPIINRLCS